MIDSDPVIIMDDVRKAGVCVSGFHTFFEQYGIDKRVFFAGRLRVSHVEHIEDANLRRVLDRTRQRVEGSA